MKVMATGTFDILHPGHVLFLEKAKELGGPDATLAVVIALDSTVERRKRIPIVPQEQRLAMVKSLKPVDEAYLGHDGDMFEIVKEIEPDIIAIGSDQDHDVTKLQAALDKRGIDAKAMRVNDYMFGELDSTCKIIKRIKHTDFKDKTGELD